MLAQHKGHPHVDARPVDGPLQGSTSRSPLDVGVLDSNPQLRLHLQDCSGGVGPGEGVRQGEGAEEPCLCSWGHPGTQRVSVEFRPHFTTKHERGYGN